MGTIENCIICFFIYYRKDSIKFVKQFGYEQFVQYICLKIKNIISMNVLSLCDGIACGRIALERAGIKVNKYYASEINEPSIKVALDNYPDIIELGDIRNWKEWNIEWKDIDLLIGGTPCQDFSRLGKEKLNFDGERSGLFFQYVNILNHIKQFNPNVKFMLENVKMKSEWADLISSHLGVNYIYINSSDLSAQIRSRYYWCNWEVPSWNDKGILLKDIITDGYVEKDKSWCMLESWNRFAKNKESLLRRYKKCLTPLIFSSPDCDAEKGFRTPNITEAERLQTVPEGYTKSVQPHIGMGLIGNGWTVDVVSHIFKGIIS